MDVATCVPLRSWPLHCPQVPPPDAGQDEVLDLCLRRRRDACPPPPASPPPPPPLSPQEQQELVFSPILGAHNKGARPTRPFKAYPKNPLSMAATESLLGYGSSEAYLQFRRRMLEQLQASSGGGASRPAGAARAPGSPLQQPSSSEPAPGDDSGKSAAYWERRRKNNEAAKRSRDARRAKEDELAIRAAFLEQENLKLRYEVTALRTETSKLRYLLFNGTDRPAQPQQQQQQQQVDLSLSSRWTCRTSPASQQPLIDLAFSNNRKYWSHLDSVFQSYSCTPKPEAKQTVLTLRRSCLRGSIETPVVSPHIVPGGGLFSGPESSRFTNHHSSKG